MVSKFWLAFPIGILNINATSANQGLVLDLVDLIFALRSSSAN
jgi:hypothetical protein